MLNNISALFAGGAVAGDYESIMTAQGTGSSGTITFTSIPSTYKHLQLRFILKGTSASGGYPTGMKVYVNNDSTTTNYYQHLLQGTGSGTPSSSGGQNYDTLVYAPGSSGLTNIYSAGIIDILDYASTSKNKTFRSLNGLDANGSGQARLTSMVWLNSSTAINRIDFVADPTYLTNWTTASQIALYGIKG